MSLTDRVKQGPPTIAGGLPCSIGQLLAALPKSERDALQGMLDNPIWAHTAITQAIADEGLRVPRSAVGHHRRQTCRCFR